MLIATVKVECEECPHGFMLVNESDFDPAVHVRYGAKPKPDGIDARVTLKHRGAGKYHVLVDGKAVAAQAEKDGPTEDVVFDSKDAAEAERQRQIADLRTAAPSSAD